MPPRVLSPIVAVVGDVLPADWLAPVGDALSFIAVDLSQSSLIWDASGFATRHRFYILERLRLDLPLVPGLAIELGEAGGYPSFVLAVRTAPIVEVAIESLTGTLWLPAAVLSARQRTADGTGWEPAVADGTPIDGFAIELTTGIRADVEGNVEIQAPTLAVPYAGMIGDTGVILDFGGADTEPIRLVLDQVPPELGPAVPETFRGLWLPRLTVHYDRPGTRLPPISLIDAAIGSGGFSGTVALGRPEDADATIDVETLEEWRTEGAPDGVLAVDVQAFQAILQYFGITFEQSIPTGSRIAGYIYMPFTASWMRLEAAIGGPDGDFMLSLGGAGDAELIDLDNDVFEILVDTLCYELREGVSYVVIDGSLRPKIGGFDWPTVGVERLAIGSNGEIDLEGGWIDLPESFALDFHAFKIDLDQIGFGSEGEGAQTRQWVGLSGGIRLIEGIPLSASVEGLRVSWRQRQAGIEPYDPDIRVSLEGIAVHLEIPGTLVLDGAVTYRELERPPETRPAESGDAASAAGVFGHVFTGSITIELTALNTEIAGELLIGDLTTYRYDDTGNLVVGDSFTALYIVMAVELPSAIPLGATGTGLYGLKGLFGMHVAPDRHLDAEGEPESWYAWYKADRGNESAYSVTKVAKWAPRFDNYAFGAGITLGTVYDDGFTINAGLLAAILIPGPVVMIEGRANLIKPRGGQGGEGALYALIVFDGIAETFQMNVDINFTLEDVITVGGGLEAFFDFNDGESWYIYIGRKEPPEKRIRAEVISIISASAYFMVDSHGILFGAAAGLDLQAQYGPVELKLILRIAFEIGVFWKEPQLTGMIELYGEISIKIFGIGIGLILQALLEGSAPQPWWIHGLARVAVSLPFPLPSFDASVEFTWGQAAPPALVDLIKSAAMVHGKLPGTSWALPLATTSEADWPVIPVDAIPALSLGKPISNVSLEPDGTDWFRSEVTEGVELAYELRDLLLEEKTPTGWTTKWTKPAPRYADLRLRPDPHAREPQAELWWYAPLDTLDRTSQRNYVDPCVAPADPERRCVDWRELPEHAVYPAVFRRGGLAFAAGLGEAPTVEKIVSAPPPTQPDRGLWLATRLVIRFPEPVAWVEIKWARNDARFDLFLDGNPVAEAPLPAGARSYQPLARVPARTLDTVHMASLQGGALIVQSICWITQREMAAASRRGRDAARTVMRGALLLEPHKTYRLSATGVRTSRMVGQDAPGGETAERMTWGFRTGGLPGTDYGALPPGITTPEPDYAAGPLNQVATYVARTVPAAGAPLFYRGYDVLIELKDPYAAAMLSPVVAVRIVDRNGTQLASTAALVLTGTLPFITPGLLALLRAEREAPCAGTPVPWTRQLLGRYIAGRLPEATQPRRMVRVELLAQGSYGTGPVFGFELATSAFRDIADHLGAGLDGGAPDPSGAWRGVRQIRTLGSGAAPAMTWIAGLRARLDRRAAVRGALAAALTVGEHDAGMTVADAFAELAALDAELGEVYRGLYEALDRGGAYTVPATPTAALPAIAPTAAVTVTPAGIHGLFVAAGLGHRPLPPRAVETNAIDVPGGWYLLIESPEPLDRVRLTVTRADTGAVLPIVWNVDGTRALVFHDGPSGLFDATPPALRWRFLCGDINAPDLSPLYRNGALASAEDVIWDLSPRG